MIKGIDVTLYERTKTGETDAFGREIYDETPVTVQNVLVAPASSTDIIGSTQLYGKKAVYTLAIPKGDAHTWENCRVDFFGQSWRCFGFTYAGIEQNIPLAWNAKVQVERYG